jgi:hypothetical protein
MKRQRFPLPTHPLTKFFEPAVESVTTSLGDASVTSYRGTVRLFLTYLGAQYAEVHSLKQLRRDPHILGWLALLRSHRPPLATITRANHVIYLRRLLEELAWTQHLPELAHLLGRDDVPRKEHHLPRPLTPEQDELSSRNYCAAMTCSAMPCCYCVTPGCASANVSISPSIACALSALASGPSTCRSENSKRNAWFPWTPWSVNWSNASVRCGHPPRPSPVLSYCLGRAAAT